MAVKVLIVDDDMGFASVMEERLAHAGYEVSAITTGHDLFQQLRIVEPNIVVLDLMLPDIGGVQCLKMIKEAYPEIQVILLTGLRDTEVEKVAKQHGAFAYLKKPCTGAVLLETTNAAAAQAAKFRRRDEEREEKT
ncbi:MAG: response regulator [Candidatus Omnitrophica bacterium]|nr:response regulator [Candidatus Omnitrophota bacterium]